MPRKTKYRLPFTKKMENGNSAMPSMRIHQGTQSAKWYQSITELPLCKFIECTVDGNLAALITGGLPAEEQLLLAWADINEQYADAMGDNDHKLINKLFKDITILAIDYGQIQALIEVLRNHRYNPLEERLNSLLYTNFKFADNRQKELDTCYRLSKSILVKIDLKTAQQEALKAKQVNGNKPTREYFFFWLINLSDHARYPVPDTITVFEFCERIKRFNKFIEIQNKKKHGRGSHR